MVNPPSSLEYGSQADSSLSPFLLKSRSLRRASGLFFGLAALGDLPSLDNGRSDSSVLSTWPSLFPSWSADCIGLVNGSWTILSSLDRSEGEEYPFPMLGLIGGDKFCSEF